MMLSLAPMEGLTGHVFRRVHAECFGPMDRYYTPFICPRVDTPFTKCERKEVEPENNAGLNVIPQLLTNNAEAFVSAAERLANMGYGEVNLNLGCPSGTVVGKGRGSGFLAHPQELKAFLQQVCAQSPVPVSVKTRLGLSNDDEYREILELFCSCALAELIVHPRLQKDGYKGVPRREVYGETLAKAPFPVAYNGDIYCLDDLNELVEAYPETRHVMLGRGILVNPALARMANGGPAASMQELEHFHDRLFGEYQAIMGGNAVSRMKEWWYYARHSFTNPVAIRRLTRKTRTVDDYRAAAHRVFAQEELADRPSRPGA